MSRWAFPSTCASGARPKGKQTPIRSALGVTFVLFLFGTSATAQKPGPATGPAPTPSESATPSAPAASTPAPTPSAPAAAAAAEATTGNAVPVQFAQAMDAVRRGDLAETARLCWIYINSREHAPQEGEAGLADKVESARFYLAESLEHLGYVHAAIDWYLQIVTERRAPQLLPRALGALERLSRAHGYDEEEIAHEGILTVAEFEELPPLLTSFIQFRQAVDDLRRGYDTWGVSHLDRIHKDTPYLSMALYARAVWRIGKGDTDQALLDLTTIIDEPKAPADVRARALHTRARLYYDRGKWDDAYADLDRVDVRYESGAEVLLEKAWARYRTKDYKTALGLIHALGAPSYAGRFAPERFLLRSLIFSKYCHFRAAKRSIEMFRDRYQSELGALRAGTDPTAIELLREAAYERTATSGAGAVHQLMQQLAAEQVRIGQQGSWGSLKETASLNHALAALYDTKMRGARFREDRQLRGAVERVANDLLDANEQMNLLEYEVGLGIYRRIGREARIASQEATRPTRIPRVSDRVYFHFDGEYWSDELPDMQFFIEDRCVD